MLLVGAGLEPQVLHICNRSEGVSSSGKEVVSSFSTLTTTWRFFLLHLSLGSLIPADYKQLGPIVCSFLKNPPLGLILMVFLLSVETSVSPFHAS